MEGKIMNKKLLSLLVLPLVGMTACSGNSFKEVKYLAFSSYNVLVTEKGVRETVSHVGTYRITDESATAIGAYLLNFQRTFNLYLTESIDPTADQVPVELPKTKVFNVLGVSVTMELQGTESKYRTYNDYYYNEGSHEVKIVEHTDEPVLNGYSSSAKAIRFYQESYSAPITIKIDDSVTEYPTANYEVKYLEHEFVSTVRERIMSVGTLNHIEVEYK